MAKNPLIRSYPKRINTPQPNKSAGILDDFAVRKVVATKEGSITKTPTDDFDLVNKKYVDGFNLNTGIDFFLYDDASTDVAGYKQLLSVVSAGAQHTLTKEISANDTLIEEWVTETDCACAEKVHTLTAGIYNFHLHLSAVIAGKVSFYYKLYIRTALGVETLLFTSIESEKVGTSESEFNVHGTLTEDYPVVVGDRLVIKMYGNTTHPVSINATMYYEGDTATRITIRGLAAPRTHSALAELNWSDAGHVIDTNLDMNSNKITELTDPTANQDGATKKYVDDNAGSDGSDHNIADHDTTATGAELNTLTDNSVANTLHRHSELVASDGSPDPAVSVDAVGIVSMPYQSGCRVRLASNQQIPHLVWTKLLFATENWDVQSEFANNKFTVKKAGKYLVVLNSQLGLLGDGKSVYGAIYKNGNRQTFIRTILGGTGDGVCNVCDIFDLSEDDWVEGYILHDHGSAINAEAAHNFMSIQKIT